MTEATTSTRQENIINLGVIVKQLWNKRRLYAKVLPIVFVVSCIFIFPQPRFYECSVSLAPETQSDKLSGNVSSLAASFGLNLGAGTGADAIYPTLYPDLFESPDFLVSLMDIEVETLDGSVKTSYYKYLLLHQKPNWLTYPFILAKIKITDLINKPERPAGDASALNPFALSYTDFMTMENLKSKLKCNVDKKTDVITITVEDQDPLICATMADSVKMRLQTFITQYRTSKARMDMEHYQVLSQQAKYDYESALKRYSDYSDRHQNPTLQSIQSEIDKLENELQFAQQKYTSLMTQYEAMKSKVQERTPAFTTIKSATIPVKPAGPKRVVFVLAMLMLATILTSGWILIKTKCLL